MTNFIEEVGWGVVRGVGWEGGILEFARPGLPAPSFEDKQNSKGLVSCICVNCWLISDFF
jgi:hypothetical protein